MRSGAEGWRSPAKVRKQGGPSSRPPNQNFPRLAQSRAVFTTHKTPWLSPTSREVLSTGVQKAGESKKTASLALPTDGSRATQHTEQSWLFTKSPPVPGDQVGDYIRTNPPENELDSFLS